MLPKHLFVVEKLSYVGFTSFDFAPTTKCHKNPIRVTTKELIN